MYLLYVHKIGTDYNGNVTYQFLFNEDKEVEIDEPDWDAYPANGLPNPPSIELIHKVGELILGSVIDEDDLILDVAQENSYFSMYDAVDGVVSLAWENIENRETYPDNRLFFKYGLSLDEVEDILYSRDLKLKIIK
jgi:hypothetical protein